MSSIHFFVKFNVLGTRKKHISDYLFVIFILTLAVYITHLNNHQSNLHFINNVHEEFYWPKSDLKSKFLRFFYLEFLFFALTANFRFAIFHVFYCASALIIMMFGTFQVQWTFSFGTNSITVLVIFGWYWLKVISLMIERDDWLFDRFSRKLKRLPISSISVIFYSDA